MQRRRSDLRATNARQKATSCVQLVSNILHVRFNSRITFHDIVEHTSLEIWPRNAGGLVRGETQNAYICPLVARKKSLTFNPKNIRSAMRHWHLRHTAIHRVYVTDNAFVVKVNWYTLSSMSNRSTYYSLSKYFHNEFLAMKLGTQTASYYWPLGLFRPVRSNHCVYFSLDSIRNGDW